MSALAPNDKIYYAHALSAVRKNLNPLAKNVKGDSNSLFATLLVGKGKTNPYREIVVCVPPHSGGVIAKKMSANTVEKPELSSNHIEETRQNRFGSRPPRCGGTDNIAPHKRSPWAWTRVRAIPVIGLLSTNEA